MAKEKLSRVIPTSTQPDVLIIPRESLQQQLNDRIKEGEKFVSLSFSSAQDLKARQKEYNIWNDYNSELLKVAFNNEENEYKTRYDKVNSYSVFFIGDSSLLDDIRDFKNDVNNKINNLKSIVERIPLLKSQILDSNISAKQSLTKVDMKKVFIVHGHNLGVQQMVARTLEKLQLEPIILSEQPNAGKTIIEKFEINSDVGFAVVLMTPDDEGKAIDASTLSKRARQNVILELGYFIGKLGRSKVCALHSEGVEIPSDFHGVVYTAIDGAGAWRYALARELRHAGYVIDMNVL